ncbi:MAG: hypothetical protein IPP49_20045 [Saprospiraceae bacterium]|nr:hypothetical protein [Saprospiraceae bacterium]
MVFHKYDVPPDAVSVVDSPRHIIKSPEIAVFGNGFTVTVLVDVLTQPLELVPVTVYVLVADGVTLIVVVVAPVLHTYVDAPDTDKEVD